MTNDSLISLDPRRANVLRADRPKLTLVAIDMSLVEAISDEECDDDFDPEATVHPYIEGHLQLVV